MVKLCQCGCGAPAPLAKRSCSAKGWVRGEPIKFINGHIHRRAGTPPARTSSGTLTAEYGTYSRAKNRCNNQSDPHWKDYGGRGIKFMFESFTQFLSELGPRPEGKMPSGQALYSLDRWPNNDGNYEPGNVRWATMREQALNRRPHSISNFTTEELTKELERRAALLV